MTGTLSMVERLLRNGDEDTVRSCCEPGGAEQFAAQVLANDPAAAKEFGGHAAPIAAHLRAMAKPLQASALRARSAPPPPNPAEWERQWSTDAALRAEFGDRKDVFLASMRHEHEARVYGVRSPSPAPTPQPSALAVAPSQAPQSARPAPAAPAATFTPAARLAVAPPFRRPEKLCEAGRQPFPFERLLAAQYPDRFVL